MFKVSKRFATLLCGVMILMTFATVEAQEMSGTAAAAAAARRGSVRRSRGARLRAPNTGARQTPAAPPPTAPVAYVNEPAQPEYLSGQAQVRVRGNEDPIIRLGLAQHGPTIVEFPASDNFFAVHPGGSFLVTYDQSPSLANDHYLVFRAGRDFVAPPPDSRRPPEPLASVSVQMQSGMFVTFVFYPVRGVARMAHRCIVMYARDEIVAARRAAGLAVNLDGRNEPLAPSASTSMRVGAAAATGANGGDSSTTATTTASATPTPEPSAARLMLASGEATNAGNERRSHRSRTPNFTREAQRAIRSALAAPQRFTQWSEASHGLTVSALAPIEIENRYRLTVIAVRNTTTNGLRLVAGQPDLEVETVDSGSRPVQIQPVMKLHTESSSLSDAIPAGATAYYAIIYEMPTLGVQQRLRLSVAQIEAADAPASTGMTAATTAR